MLDCETGDGCRIFGRLLLLKVVVGWNCNNGILYLGAGSAVRLSYLLHSLENHGRDLLRLETLTLPIDLHDDIRLIVWALLDFEGP